MPLQTLYRITADLVLLTHITIALFITLGLLLILIGKTQHWQWVSNPWFRCTHLASIGVVAIQSWLGRICPLTTLEMFLRQKAGEATYPGAFIAHWLQELLYYQAPEWVFVVGYTVFVGVVVFAWWWVPPRFKSG